MDAAAAAQVRHDRPGIQGQPLRELLGGRLDQGVRERDRVMDAFGVGLDVLIDRSAVEVREGRATAADDIGHAAVGLLHAVGGGIHVPEVGEAAGVILAQHLPPLGQATAPVTSVVEEAEGDQIVDQDPGRDLVGPEGRGELGGRSRLRQLLGESEGDGGSDGEQRKQVESIGQLGTGRRRFRGRHGRHPLRRLRRRLQSVARRAAPE